MFIHLYCTAVFFYGKLLFYRKNNVIVVGGFRLGHTTESALSYNIIILNSIICKTLYEIRLYAASWSENFGHKQISCDGLRR